MKIALEWGTALKLRDGKRESLIYTLSPAKLPGGAGIYVFGRRFGKRVEALYVGRGSGWPKCSNSRNAPSSGTSFRKATT